MGPGATGPLQIVARAARAPAVARAAAADRGIARGAARTAGRRGACGRDRDPAAGSLRPGRRRDDRPPAGGVARRCGARRRRRRKPRSREAPGARDVARDRRRARARLPAPAVRAAGAADRRCRCSHQPARDRRGVRRREVALPGRRRALAARLPAPGLPRCLGTGVLLRDDLRDLDGLHRVPAVEHEGALGPDP